MEVRECERHMATGRVQVHSRNLHIQHDFERSKYDFTGVENGFASADNTKTIEPATPDSVYDVV